MGVGAGFVWGLGIAGGLGGIYSLVNTIKKSDENDSFYKNLCKVISETSFAALVGGVLGAGIGGSIGIACGAADAACDEYDKRYRKQTKKLTKP